MALKTNHKTLILPRLLVLAGLALIAAIILVTKEKPQAAIAPASNIPEAQLQRALAAGQPTLVFYHSDNCKSCIEMMDTVAQVYPEFSSSVSLVDVNVYADWNQRLLQQQKIQYIPTLIFYDQRGNRDVYVGVMENEDLHQKLETIQK